METPNLPKKVEEDEQSEWSLSSLQQLKGLDLNELKQQQEGQHIQHQPHTHQAKSKIQPKYPPPQQITTDTKLFEVGKIVNKVGELLIIEAKDFNNLVDLDNWLFSSNKQCLGFVIDIFGRVENPFYAIKLLEQVNAKINNLEQLVGVTVFYAEGCKTLTEEDIKSIKEKSSVNKQADEPNSDSSSQSDKEQDFRSNFAMRRKQKSPKRRGSFEQEPFHRRQRTREKKSYNRFDGQDNGRRRHHGHHDWRNNHEIQKDRQHNQAYLEGMYNMYYSQMMQLYNGQNGMPLPKPPVFPMFQQQTQTQPPIFGQAQQFQPQNFPTMPPMPPMPQPSQFPQGPFNQSSTYPYPQQKLP